jgi:hypothetical protein
MSDGPGSLLRPHFGYDDALRLGSFINVGDDLDYARFAEPLRPVLMSYTQAVPFWVSS